MKMLEIKSIKIDDYSKVDYMSLAEKYLDDKEFRSFKRFKSVNRKCEFVLGRFLIKMFISKLYNVSINQICLQKSEFGKLYIDFNEIKIDIPPVFFNISHTTGMIVVIFSTYSEVGIDIEMMNPHQVVLTNSVFNESELFLLESINDFNNRCEYFYHLWTRKEAYLKAIGVGFSILPSTIEVLGNEINSINDTFTLFSFKFKTNYYVSIAIPKYSCEKNTKYEIKEVSFCEIR